MISPSYLDMVEKLLFQDEVVRFTARQRRIGPGGAIIAPSVVVATNERLLVVRDVLMLHIKWDVDELPYPNITYTKITHGLVSSTLTVGVLAYTSNLENTRTNTVEIEGLRYTDAVELSRLVDDMVIKIKGKKPQETVTESQEDVRAMAKSRERWKVTCKKCNAKNDFDAHYCSNCGAVL